MDRKEARRNEEYKYWKRNTPFLYDLVFVHALEWPSLSVQWIPHREISPSGIFSKQQLLLGTHTSQSEQNFLLRANIHMPTPAAMSNRVSTPQEIDRFRCVSGKIEVTQRIPHAGEVHRARYMPQDSDVLVTKTIHPELYVFNTKKHPAQPDPETEIPPSALGQSATPSHDEGKNSRHRHRRKHYLCSPDAVLVGHTREGWGLAWNASHKGHLISGADDTQILLWDVEGILTPSAANPVDPALLTTQEASQTSLSPSPVKLDPKAPRLLPLMRFKRHTNVVEAVSWCSRQPCVFCSGGDDGLLILWDTRQPGPTAERHRAHTAEINCTEYSPHHEHYIATGSSDGLVKLWDQRNLANELHVFNWHRDEVFNVVWSPHMPNILASSDAMRRMFIWDLSKIGDDTTPQLLQDGPPELMFVHGGHTAKISDLDFNPFEPYTFATVSEDNIIEIWSLGEAVCKEHTDLYRLLPDHDIE